MNCQLPVDWAAIYSNILSVEATMSFHRSYIESYASQGKEVPPCRFPTVSSYATHSFPVWISHSGSVLSPGCWKRCLYREESELRIEWWIVRLLYTALVDAKRFMPNARSTASVHDRSRMEIFCFMAGRRSLCEIRSQVSPTPWQLAPYHDRLGLFRMKKV